MVRPERISIQFDIFHFEGMYWSLHLFDQPPSERSCKLLQKQFQSNRQAFPWCNPLKVEGIPWVGHLKIYFPFFTNVNNNEEYIEKWEWQWNPKFEDSFSYIMRLSSQGLRCPLSHKWCNSLWGYWRIFKNFLDLIKLLICYLLFRWTWNKHLRYPLAQRPS